MAIFKRGTVYWYNFIFEGKRHQRSTKQGNPRVARQIEAAHKTRLAKREAGIEERKPVPSLLNFQERFLGEIRVERAQHSETIEFYEAKYSGLLRYRPLAQAALDRIDEELIAQFTAKMIAEDYARSTVNRHLATLKRALRLAARWNIIKRVPRIRLLSDENQRDFVLSREQQVDYLDVCPEFLRNWATFGLETGMRRKELYSLEWSDVHFEPAPKARLGYIHVRGTKSKNSKRNLSLTATAQMVLLRQRQISKCEHVFVMDRDPAQPASVSAMDHCHERVRKLLDLPAEFVLHSLRHTFATRLGEQGADAFTIMRILGHAVITTSQRYVHPTSEMENAFLAQERASQEFSQKDAGLTTVSTTVEPAAGGVIQ